LPRVSFYGITLDDVRKQEFISCIQKVIYQVLKEHPEEEAIGTMLDSFNLFDGSQSIHPYLVAVPIERPACSSEESGIPYVAALSFSESGRHLTEQEKRLMKLVLLEFQRIVRLRKELAQMRGIEDLLREFTTLSSPNEVAAQVARYISDQFNANEVAVLEKRGAFLCVMEAHGFQYQDLPPLHIPTTKALVCNVARDMAESYVPNVRDLNSDFYLPINRETRTQYTLPLIWRHDLVGVLMVGLRVIDGLPQQHRKNIQAIASHCAAAIIGSRRTTEERAVRHMLNDILASVTLKLRVNGDNPELHPEVRGKLQSSFDLLANYQSFVEAFYKIPKAQLDQDTDLRKVIAEYQGEYLANMQEALHKTSPNIEVQIESYPEPLRTRIPKEDFILALHNIVFNGIESMEQAARPGKLTITVKTEERWNKASAKELRFAVVRVADQGPGIREEDQLHVFELFFSTKEGHLGSGLNIARRIIEGYGGRVELDFSNSSGSVFSLWVPIE
jgi:signal transduction histidine kinase